MGLLSRKDVPIELTWDLTHLYATEAEMLAEHETTKKMCAQLTENYKGKLTTPEQIDACLDAWQELMAKMDHVASYCSLAASVDYYDAKLQERQSMIQRDQAQMAGEYSFIESELSAADESLLRESMAVATKNRHYLEEILRQKPHRLDPKTEEVLTRLSATLEAPYELYHVVKLTDMKFDPFVADGVEYPLGYSLFEDDYEYDARTAVRRGAFRAFSDKLKQYENITAAIYNTQVQREKNYGRPSRV